MAYKKQAKPKAECAPVEFTGEQWHARRKESPKVEIRGVWKCTVTVELVWGKLVRETSGNTRIIGDSYHEIHGPTAQKSIEEYAERLNRDKVPPSRATKCIADGARAPKDGGKDQMFLPMQLRPTPTAP